LSPSKVTDVKCKCGGDLRKTETEVEFFGIDFGVKKAEVCNRCGSEYLSQETMDAIEAEVKKRGLYGLERRGKVSKSGNSLVVRIPQEIVKSMRLRRDLPVVIYPSDRSRLVMEVEESV